MSEWYEKAYRGGGPVQVKFPRPLYPPDAAAKGKTPSKDGPDVVAYKRAICHAGRWGEWAPDTWDDSFSNAFSHGKGPNVKDTGIAGFQRQQKLDDTGWIGEKTFNNMRYALISDPSAPHYGEPILDSVCVDLLEQAYEMFNEPPEEAKLTRKQIPSPNYSSRGGLDVRLIVLHTAEGATTIESLGSWFANPANDVSSHTGIDDKAGVIGEYVRRDYKAWTAMNANPVAVQTELCAFAKWSTSEWNKHPNMLENCARWIAEEAAHFDIPITKLTPSQAQGSGRGVCQHADLGSWGGGHWDCGSGFPIDKVLDMAQGGV